MPSQRTDEPYDQAEYLVAYASPFPASGTRINVSHNFCWLNFAAIDKAVSPSSSSASISAPVESELSVLNCLYAKITNNSSLQVT